MDEHKITAKYDAALTVTLKDRADYAVFFLFSSGEHYHALAIESSYGGFAYAWSNPGGDFREFLMGLELDYVQGKMARGEQQEFCGHTTAVFCRKDILHMRRNKDCEKWVAREAWDDLPGEFNDVGELRDWVANHDLYENEDWWRELARYVPGGRHREFKGLYDKFWKAFAEALKEAPR